MSLKESQIAELRNAAREAAEFSYSPYSRYRVGASVLTDQGVFSGTNIENASSNLGICAERVAIANALSNGASEIIGLAVHCLDARSDESGAALDSAETMPCGACRQWLVELAPDALVVTNGTKKPVSAESLLPNPFKLPPQES